MLAKKCVQAIPLRLVSTLSETETSEALRHVQHVQGQERKVRTAPKLDRSRVGRCANHTLPVLSCMQGFLTGRNYTYCIVGPQDLERANTLLYDTYHPDEPITKHLGLAQGGKRIPDADRMVEDVVPRHLSM